ncbi:MAG TPA: hypothetical protein VGC79_21640 [Polyangiaceae bacterium]
MSMLGLTRVRLVPTSDSGDELTESLQQHVEAVGFQSDAFNSNPCRDYEELAAELDQLGQDELLRTACVVDLRSEALQVWSTLEDSHYMRPTALVWRYPEIYWIFVITDENAKELRRDLAGEARILHFVTSSENIGGGIESLLTRHAKGLRTWFDPANLRRSCVCVARLLPGLSPPMRRGRLGIVFDEEVTFAAFNGYLLHRSGISTRIVSTAAEFVETHSLGDGGGPFVILEDVELIFADADESIEAELLYPSEDDKQRTIQGRLKYWGLNAAATQPRIFVSSSLVKGQISVIKPFGGLYEREICARLGVATPLPLPSHGGHHSAPAAHQAISGHLLQRLRGFECVGTVSAVHGALLALCAERLLGSQTYAMALESLSARHAYEVRAECGFSGASEEIEIRRRVAELRSSVNRLVFREGGVLGILRQLAPWTPGFLGNWRKLYKRNVQATNGLLEALGVLRDILSNNKKLEEEEYVLQRIRRLRIRSFLLRRSFTRWLPSLFLLPSGTRGIAVILRFAANIVEAAVRAVLALPLIYVTEVLNPLLLALAIAGWIVGFGLAFESWGSMYWMDLAKDLSIFDWIRHSAVTFLALQQGIFGDPQAPHVGGQLMNGDGYAPFWNLSVAEMALGYLHMGLLVAVLVQRITRR